MVPYIVTDDFTVYKCFAAAHSVRIGPPPPVNKHVEAQRDTGKRRCGWGGCQKLPRTGRERCALHKAREVEE